ncbi:cerebral dopamine neurotrophic factor isoform X1 [Paramormyrops kingsleyae]|uniref:cerebral dopamine neurotrophic factor isoform X1 n=1 Tax=Paramormyrops kingsleyae TaxID=1676925 RepID=UPI000CD65040|nr:mesencephalic astrocyte-derived neurotrophic factor-like isoform X1 [Paramormyrops kingsleyae]
MEKCNLFCMRRRAADFAQVLSMKFSLLFVNISEVVFLCVMLDFSSAGDCEVCVGFLSRLYEGLMSRHVELTPAVVEEDLLRACGKAVGKENRLCYYLGATSDAATKITGEVTRPMSFHLPVNKICERLQKRDSQICELTYEKQVTDLSREGLSKLRVAELKNILNSWGEVCRACIEKSDFISLIQEVATKYSKQTGQKAEL